MTYVFERRLRLVTLATCSVFGIVALFLLSGRAYVIGVFLAPALLAPCVIIERLLARIGSADPDRPRVVPLIYAHMLFAAALGAAATGASSGFPDSAGRESHGSILGLFVGVALWSSWILVAVFGALGRKYRPILAVVAGVFFVIAVFGAMSRVDSWGAVAVALELGLFALAALTNLHWILERRIAREFAVGGAGLRGLVAAPAPRVGVVPPASPEGVETCGGDLVSGRAGVVAAGHAATLVFVVVFGAAAAVLATPWIAVIGLVVVIERRLSGDRGGAQRGGPSPNARSQMTLLIYAHVIAAVLVLAGEMEDFAAFRDSPVDLVVVVVSLSIAVAGWLAVLMCRSLGPRYRWVLLVVAAASFANWIALRWYGVHWPNEIGSAATKALTRGYVLAAIRAPLLFSISALTLLQWGVQRRLACDAALRCFDGADALRWSRNSASTRPEGMR
jgi:hypothetical protein